MRAFDWAGTPLGSPDTWPENLRIALGICLTSCFPMHVWWGPELTLFYNDAYISFLGKAKHPAVLGRSGREAWSELWDTLGPMIESVLRTGVASGSEDILMFFDRELPREEVYVTFSFSPVLGAGGEVDGLFCACTESTEKLVGNRRLEMLSRLGLPSTESRTPADACKAMAEVLRENPLDVPFAAIYLVDEAVGEARLAASVGLSDGAGRLPETVSPDEERAGASWPIASVLRTRRAAPTLELASLGLELPSGPWPEPASQAVVLPVRAAAHASLAAVLIAGVSPRRPFDAAYQAFFELVAGHIGTALVDARAYEEERRRAEALKDGTDDYLVKPFSARELLARVETHLELGRLRNARRKDAKLLLAAEQQARAVAEQTSRMKDEFLARVSHELATPVAAMRMWLEVVKDEPATPGFERALAGLRHCVHAQSKMVADLLDTARALTGRFPAVLEPSEPAPIVEAAVAAIRPFSEQKGVALELSLGETPLVNADAERLRQVLSNLLSNAVKFTPAGGRVTVRLEPEGGGLAIVVQDTGHGFAPEFRRLLFTPFRQEQEGTTRTSSGLGLGLAIARQLVELHGGRISGESEGRGRGATFTVWLPGIAEEDATGEPLWGERGDRRIEGLRVLLVEDDEQTRVSVASVLEQHGAKVETAESAARALTALRRGAFDVMLCDIAMPEEDGYSLIRKVRALDAPAARLPAAAFTAHMRVEDVRHALNAGFQLHIPKSTEPAQLVAHVWSLGHGAPPPVS